MNATSKLEAITVAVNAAFQADLSALTAAADRALEKSKADPEAGKVRIRELSAADGGGFALEQKTVRMNGTCQWARLFYSRSRKDVEAAKVRRGL